MIPKQWRDVRPLDAAAMQAAEAHWDSLAKPLRSLGVLEQMVIRLAGITGQTNIAPLKKAVLIYCADNGIVEEGVTQTDSSVTAAVAQNFTKGIASINALSRVAGADVCPVDIGIASELNCPGLMKRKVAYGTKNFAKEPAMTREMAIQAIQTGIDLVREKQQEGYTLLVTGEMGIGNTTASSAVFAALEGVDPEQVTGRGAGLTQAGIQHKIQVIRDALALHRPDAGDVIDVLAKVGSLDLCGIAGTFLGGAVYRVPVLIDGFISAVAANCAVRLVPACRDFLFATHCSAEPAGKMALDALGMQACLQCGMFLGEGTGGVIGAKLFDFALAAYGEIADFTKAAVEAYELLE